MWQRLTVRQNGNVHSKNKRGWRVRPDCSVHRCGSGHTAAMGQSSVIEWRRVSQFAIVGDDLKPWATVRWLSAASAVLTLWSKDHRRRCGWIYGVCESYGFYSNIGFICVCSWSSLERFCVCLPLLCLQSWVRPAESNKKWKEARESPKKQPGLWLLTSFHSYSG